MQSSLYCSRGVICTYKSEKNQPSTLKKIWVDATLKNLRWHPIKIWVDFKSLLRVQIKRANIKVLIFLPTQITVGRSIPTLSQGYAPIK